MTVRINLAPGERKPVKRRERTLPSIPSGMPEWLPRSPTMLVGLVGVIALLAAVFLYFGERGAVGEARAAIEDAQADSTRLHSQLARVQAMEAAQRELAARVTMMENVVEGRLYWIQFMEAASRALPPYTWLETVDREELEDQVRIGGATFSNAAVTEYMRGLEASPLLRNVTLVGVTRTQEDSLQYQSFTLIADLEDYETVVIKPDTTSPTDTNAQGGQ